MAETSNSSETPTVNTGTVMVNTGSQTVNFDTLFMNAEIPTVNADTVGANVEIPVANIETPIVNAEIPVVGANVEVPVANVEKPVASAETPNISRETSVTGPESTANNAASPPLNTSVADHDCAVCLEKMVQPTELPCKHVFCFLCVKGIAQKTRCCALCRREIPLNYFDSPHLLNDPAPENQKGKACSDDDDKPLWYYKGRSGWWQYDDRTCEELETAFSKGAKFCEVLIAGFLYVIDFGIMTQVRKDDPKRRRAVKRDTQRALPVKGVAGVHASNQAAGSLPKKPKLNHPTSSFACDGDAGPSCSVIVFNLVPSNDEPSTSDVSSSKQKDSGRSRKLPSNAKVDEVIVLSSDDSNDEFDEFDDSAVSDDSDDSDNSDNSENSDDDDDDNDDSANFVFQVHLDGRRHGPTKRKASNTTASSSSKKRQQLNSAEYKTALELMKAEHDHLKESMKLKHIRSLVDKKTQNEIATQKKLNRAEFRQLEKKQLEEHRKFLRQHRDIDNLYD